MYLTCVISKCVFVTDTAFLIVNKTTKEKQFIQGDEKLVEFFESHYSLPCLFHKLLKNEYVHHNGTLYHLSYNSHPDCQRIKMRPKEYRHLLHDERRQEMNK